MVPPQILLHLAAAAQAIDATPVTQAAPQLHTPDAIAPAALPYLACLYASRGLPLLRGSDGNQINYDKNGGDCSAARAHAKADALRMLGQAKIPGGISPSQYVEDALAEMDAYVASLPVRRSADGSARLSIVGLPVTIEDEVQPAYNRYEGCLKDQAGDTPFTVDSLMTVFQQAMTICRSVRDSAVTEAENALAKRGWDAAARAKAAENTFSKVDESWLAMGRQFRDSLLARLSRPMLSKGSHKSR